MPRSVVPWLIAFGAVLGGCGQQPETEIWVEPGSTADALTFVLGDQRHGERPVYAQLRVDPCDVPPRRFSTENALWIAEIHASRAVYGHGSDSVRSQIPARPLTPGCYRASTLGAGSVVFVVDSLGGVAQLDGVPD